jgi:FlaA1/EpsC-like NDP-sugar epimerase/lipopolysaccharide/colanic/teichoic acid biosynthesis glycosyltransferase
MHLAKRLTDILLSLVGLIILIPILPVIGLLIKLDSRGPVFYLTNRVGKNMKIFKMYKFRTMLETPIEVGESVSPQFDPRVTSFGRFLRRTKMNELPQFINILKGEMTFVGPRPEAPDLAELYPEEAKRVFSVKPGLVGPSTILGRNEEESFPPGVDVKKYYIENIFPSKVKMDLEYVDNPSFFKDLIYILTGVKETLIGALSKRHIQDNRSQIYLLIADLFLIVCSYILVFVIYSRNIPGEANLIRLLLILPVVIAIRLSCNIYFGMYSSLIRYISYHEILGAFKAVTCGSIFLVLIGHIFGLNYYSIKIALIDWAYLMLLLSGLRFGLRFYWEKRRGNIVEKDKRRILIYGASDAGYSAYRALALNENSPFETIGFIDDAPDKYGKGLNGLKVLGNRYHIKALAQLYRVEEILIAEQDIEPDRLTEILKICQELDLRVRILPTSINDFVSMSRHTSFLRNLEFSDILPLQRIHSNHAAVKEVLLDKTVLINGSGGSLGLELCRKILQLGCRRLIIVEGYESYLNEIVAGLLKGFSNESIVPVLNDMSRTGVLDEVFETYNPDFVIHAGMRKYVPFLAVDLGNIGRTNYVRTFHLAKTAAKFQCELFVMISSLMAAKGGNLITDSLRVAEVSLEHFFSDTNTRLIITRICDIAENRGGIVSVIEDQIVNQGTVILPSRSAQSCLISKHSAAEFLLQTLVDAKKSLSERKVFICDGGSPIPLIEITRKLANYYGLKLGSNLAVKYAAQSDGPASISMFPPIISSSASLYSRDIKGMKADVGGNGEKLKFVFRDFVLADNKELAHQDWKVRTQELIRLYGPDLFARES